MNTESAERSILSILGSRQRASSSSHNALAKPAQTRLKCSPRNGHENSRGAPHAVPMSPAFRPGCLHFRHQPAFIPRSHSSTPPAYPRIHASTHPPHHPLPLWLCSSTSELQRTVFLFGRRCWAATLLLLRASFVPPALLFAPLCFSALPPLGLAACLSHITLPPFEPPSPACVWPGSGLSYVSAWSALVSRHAALHHPPRCHPLLSSRCPSPLSSMDQTAALQVCILL